MAQTKKVTIQNREYKIINVSATSAKGNLRRRHNIAEVLTLGEVRKYKRTDVKAGVWMANRLTTGEITRLIPFYL